MSESSSHTFQHGKYDGAAHSRRCRCGPGRSGLVCAGSGRRVLGGLRRAVVAGGRLRVCWGTGLRVERPALAAPLQRRPGDSRSCRVGRVAGGHLGPCTGRAGAASDRPLMLELDANLHAPARLRLMTMLTAVSEVEFSTVRDRLEVSDSVLSKHVGTLASLG